MPNCFQLYRKTDPSQAVALQKIDEEMCAHFNLPRHPTAWHNGWYDFIGFLCAMGKSWDEIRQDCRDAINDWPNDPNAKALFEHDIAIVDWLEANFTTSSWAEIGEH